MSDLQNDGVVAQKGWKPRGVTLLANWKMNHTSASTQAFLDEVAQDPLVREWASRYQASASLAPASSREASKSPTKSTVSCSGMPEFSHQSMTKGSGLEGDGDEGCGLSVGLFPSFLSLQAAASALASHRLPIRLGAQNVASERQGAFTGEVSGVDLKSVGVQSVLVGHSERRTLFQESDAEIQKKATLVLQEQMQVVLCVGESLAERKAQQTLQVLERQVRLGLPQMLPSTAPSPSQLIIAYEPVWAIGSGLSATPAEVQAVHQAIRSMLKQSPWGRVVSSVRIVYGGSVNAQNLGAFLQQSEVDGVLVGGASVQAASFLQLLRRAYGAPAEA